MKENKALSEHAETRITGGAGSDPNRFFIKCPNCGSTDIRTSSIPLGPGNTALICVCNACGYSGNTKSSSTNDTSMM